ncbi:MAG: FxsA family protein [Beijerinckiaceae bacterium]|jgi:UPF0716 protein FxsA
MTLRNKITLGLVLWLASELVVFTLVVDQIGLGAAILLGLLTSIAGGSLLKRAGLSALARLRQEAGQNGAAVFQGSIALDETLAAIAAVLLLIPGFITDALGLILALAAPRVWIAGWLRGGASQAGPDQPRPQHGPATIDLEPGEYRTIDEPKRTS